MKYIPLTGRILFCLLFLVSAPGHFAPAQIQFAAASGVPFAQVLVPLSGILEAAGALSIIIGYRVRWGALLLVVFLVPVTFMLHDFWNDPAGMARQINMVMFLKNLSLIGGALIIGSAPVRAIAPERRHNPQAQPSW